MAKKKVGKKGMKVGDYCYVIDSRSFPDDLMFYQTWKEAVDDILEEGDTVYIVEVKSKQVTKLTLK